MKSKQTLIIIGQFVIISILVVFVSIQNTEAKQLRKLAEQASVEAEQHRLEAERQRALADANAQEAMLQAAEAQRQMQLCLESQKQK